MVDRKGRRPPTVEVVRRPAPPTGTPRDPHAHAHAHTPAHATGLAPTPELGPADA